MAARLDDLPADARSLIERALAHGKPGSKSVQGLVSQALAAVGYPLEKSHWEPLYPTPQSLTPAQRGVVDVLCDERFAPVEGYAMPYHAPWRSKWFRSTGVLEKTTVDVAHAGGRGTEPLWRALQLKHLEHGGLAPVVSVLNALPFETALSAIEELVADGASAYKLNFTDLFASGELRLVRELGAEGKNWALGIGPRLERMNRPNVRAELSPYIFLALVRARVPIDRKLEAFFPAPHALAFRNQKPPAPTYPRFDGRDYLELALALPDDRRDAVLAPHMYSMRDDWALVMLERFPSPALVGALLAGYQRDVVEGSRPDRLNAWIKNLTVLGKKHPAILAAVQASVGAQAVPAELFVLDGVVIDDAAKLDSTQRAQLTRAAKLWDGKQLPLSKRLGRDGPRDEPKDGINSFFGRVEFRRIGNAAGEHLFDALLYDIGAGTIFQAGTSKDVGYMGDQLGIKLYDEDASLLLGLRAVLGPKPKSRAKRSAGPVAKRRPPPRKRRAKKG